MVVPTHAPATYKDLFGLPDTVIGQIIHGQLIVLPRPAPKHAAASSNIGYELGNPYHKGRGGPGGWWILDEPEIHLDGHILVPDLAGWRRERMPKLPHTAYFALAPDWICEVLSPATASLDRATKMPIYAQTGVAFIWLVDPEGQTLEVFELHNNRWVLWMLYKEQDTIIAPPFEAVSFTLESLWQ
jgi:Uma2 family endonuclease